MKLPLLVLACLSSGVAFAQSSQDIISHMAATGRVVVLQDPRLDALVGTTPKVYYATPEAEENANKPKVKGFRIRVYSGNQQGASKTKAYKIQTEITDVIPELSTYVTFKTPNWRLMVGDFRTSEEANSMLRVLRKEFPEYSKEMFVINDDIEI